MNELVKSLPEIITKAAESHLGILALMIIGLAILAVFFFRGAAEKVQVVIFVMLFFGVVAFGAAVVWKAKSRDKGLALVASIWKVELGRKTMLGTKEFSSGAGHGVPPATLKEFAEWVSNQLKLTARTVPVRIEVEKFAGPDKITERVRNELKANPLIQIVDPVMLNSVPEHGIDYIVSGKAKPKTP
jgi:hypothetical protein